MVGYDSDVSLRALSAPDAGECVVAVLSQDPGPNIMQIEVIDDCSTQDDGSAGGGGKAGAFFPATEKCRSDP